MGVQLFHAGPNNEDDMKKAIIGKVDTTNKKFRAYKHWKYVIRFEDVDSFSKLRAWCWEHMGPSREFSSYRPNRESDTEENEKNLRWCWQEEGTTYEVYRIYLHRDEDTVIPTLML